MQVVPTRFMLLLTRKSKYSETVNKLTLYRYTHLFREQQQETTPLYCTAL